MAPLTGRPLWSDRDTALPARPALPGDTDTDVAIVGAGFTGLWAAHHLLRHNPALRVTVIEREVAGWGASGRNGGWCSAYFPAAWPRVTLRYGADPATRMALELRRTVDDIGAWCRSHDVAADFAKGGALTLARGTAQTARLRADVGGLDDNEWLDAAAATARVRAGGVDGALFTPHCASLHPGRLVEGLARVVEAQGAHIHERTTATDIRPGRVATDHGLVRAGSVLRATEAYTADLTATHRLLAPVWSLVVATEPLPERVWEQIGWRQRETLSDGRHLIIYAQRTADDRIVFGGRGAPYRFGSATGGTSGHGRAFAALQAAMHELLPQTVGCQITHRWGGVVGIPRDWMPSVSWDRSAGIGWAGGYVGDGVAASALAGRTLADLVLGRATDRTRLPWVGHQWRRWEPEPLRWLGIRGMTRLMASADRAEARTGKPARRAALFDRLVS